MDVLHRFGPSSAGDVCRHIDDPPSDTAMRTLLRILEDKGIVRHTREGKRHVYAPVMSRSVAQRSALRHVVSTFFAGGVRDAVAALLDTAERPLTAAERKELIAIIRQADERGE